MEITKVKISDKGVYIEYTRSFIGAKKACEEECSLGLPDAPLPEFKEALAAQDKRVAWICGFKEHSDIRTTGIVITTDKEGLERVSFLAEKSLPGYDQPLILRTPPSANENVSAICAHAEDYINGKRAQQTLCGIA